MDRGKNLTYDQENNGTYGSDKHQEKYAAFQESGVPILLLN